MSVKKNKNVSSQEYTNEEILSILSERLVKGESANNLANELNISNYDLFGYIKQLKDNGINITFTDRGDDIRISISHQPDFTKEKVYKFKTSDTHTKVGVISDLRFGSKNEQIAMLNDIYRKFAKDGVSIVIVAGNLLEGKYNKTDETKFGKSLITNDAYGQADHLIKYFPCVEGIRTLFITGDTDHTWGKELDVGKYIASKRDDMVYLGPKNCNLYFNNVCIKVESLKKTGESYTIAYSPQKYSRSMSSYEDYDAIFLGGTLTAQEFPQIRDTRIFAIPSVVERTPKIGRAHV